MKLFERFIQNELQNISTILGDANEKKDISFSAYTKGRLDNFIYLLDAIEIDKIIKEAVEIYREKNPEGNNFK